MITLEIDYNSHRRLRRSRSEKAIARCRSILRGMTLLPKAVFDVLFRRESEKAAN